MRADFNRHAAGDPAAIFMQVHDAALPYQLSATIEHLP
jgi:hypothetical protein